MPGTGFDAFVVKKLLSGTWQFKDDGKISSFGSLGITVIEKPDAAVSEYWNERLVQYAKDGFHVEISPDSVMVLDQNNKPTGAVPFSDFHSIKPRTFIVLEDGSLDIVEDGPFAGWFDLSTSVSVSPELVGKKVILFYVESECLPDGSWTDGMYKVYSLKGEEIPFEE